MYKRFFVTIEHSGSGHTYRSLAVEGVPELVVLRSDGSNFIHGTFLFEETRLKQGDSSLRLVVSGLIDSDTGDIQYDEVPRVISQ